MQDPLHYIQAMRTQIELWGHRLQSLEESLPKPGPASDPCGKLRADLRELRARRARLDRALEEALHQHPAELARLRAEFDPPAFEFRSRAAELFEEGRRVARDDELRRHEDEVLRWSGYVDQLDDSLRRGGDVPEELLRPVEHLKSLRERSLLKLSELKRNRHRGWARTRGELVLSLREQRRSWRRVLQRIQGQQALATSA